MLRFLFFVLVSYLKSHISHLQLVALCINNYKLLHPEVTAPISEEFGTMCWTLQYENPVSGNTGWYPQGHYQFCAEWVDKVYGPRYRIIGGYPPHWTYFLHEFTLPDAPVDVYVNTAYAGSLPGKCNCLSNSMNINGTWRGVFPAPLGQKKYTITGSVWKDSVSVNSVRILPVEEIDMVTRTVIISYPKEALYQKITWKTE